MNFLRFLSHHPSLLVLAALVVFLVVMVIYQQRIIDIEAKAKREKQWAQFQREQQIRAGVDHLGTRGVRDAG